MSLESSWLVPTPDSVMLEFLIVELYVMINVIPSLLRVKLSNVRLFELATII